MKPWAWALGIVVPSLGIAGCGESTGDGSEGDGGGKAGSSTGGSGATGGSSGAGGFSAASGSGGSSAPTGGSGGGSSNPLCDAYAAEFVRECPQNGGFDDAQWLCEEGFAQYTPRGCESEWAALVVCATEGTYECVTGSVDGCDAVLDALMECAS